MVIISFYTICLQQKFSSTVVLLQRRVRRNKHTCKEKDQRAYSLELSMNKEVIPESLETFQIKILGHFKLHLSCQLFWIFFYFVRKKISCNYSGWAEKKNISFPWFWLVLFVFKMVHTQARDRGGAETASSHVYSDPSILHDCTVYKNVGNTNSSLSNFSDNKAK